MKFLILCSLVAATFAAPGGLLGYGGGYGLGLGHGIGLGGGIAYAAPAIHAAPVAVAAPAPVLVQHAPTIVKAIAPAATSSVSISQVHIQHPSPVIKYAAAPVAVAQPIIKYAAAPAISVAHPVAVAQPVIKYAAAPSIIASGFGGHGYGLHGFH